MVAKSTTTGFTGSTGWTGTSFTRSALSSSRPPTSHVRTYNWPPIQLNFWIFVILLASTSIIGVFSSFIQIQEQLLLPIPWYAHLQVHVGNRS
ncbi:hypothetical protein NW767_006213 [Fusarium falciforme]|nr:hypothetical protein NW767_006213 [Fusarium falciforme]